MPDSFEIFWLFIYPWIRMIRIIRMIRMRKIVPRGSSLMESFSSITCQEPPPPLHICQDGPEETVWLFCVQLILWKCYQTAPLPVCACLGSKFVWLKLFINTANESGLFHGASFHPEYMDLNGHHGHNHLHDHRHHLHHVANLKFPFWLFEPAP